MKEQKTPDWELEAPFDAGASLQELLNSPSFREVSGEDGISVTAGTRVPSWLWRRIVKLKELEGSPYELASDVLRDALYLGLRVLHMRHGLSPDWDVETKLATVVDSVSAGRRVRGQLKELISGLEDMCKEGDEVKAAEVLTEYVLAAAALADAWHKKKVFKGLNDSRIVREVAEYCLKDIKKLLKQEGK